jgi:hypothetical protein
VQKSKLDGNFIPVCIIEVSVITVDGGKRLERGGKKIEKDTNASERCMCFEKKLAFLLLFMHFFLVKRI